MKYIGQTKKLVSLMTSEHGKVEILDVDSIVNCGHQQFFFKEIKLSFGEAMIIAIDRFGGGGLFAHVTLPHSELVGMGTLEKIQEVLFSKRAVLKKSRGRPRVTQQEHKS